VIGVELSEELACVAQKNIRFGNASRIRAAKIRVMHEDDGIPMPRIRCWFLNNPFECALLERLVSQLAPPHICPGLITFSTSTPLPEPDHRGFSNYLDAQIEMDAADQRAVLTRNVGSLSAFRLYVA